MPTYEIRPLQLRILEILKSVDVVCRTHNLKYFIWAGTMIGAVRHKGFIPWDDDLDIAMPRPDYERLINHSDEWLPKPFELVSAENNSKYPLPFAKIQDSSTTLIERLHLKFLGGIYLDVFPIDGVPNGKIQQMLTFAQYEYYKRVLYLLFRDPYKHGHGLSSWMPLICRKIYSLQTVQNKIRKILLRYDYNQCSLVADYDDGMKGVIEKNILGNPTLFDFEDTSVFGVEQYDVYLRKKYGDYMKIPSVSHQRQHNFHLLDLEHPYKEHKENDSNS